MIKGSTLSIPQELIDIIEYDDYEELIKYFSNKDLSHPHTIEYVKFAANHNSLSCVQAFLDLKYNIAKRDKLGRNIFHYACAQGNSNLVELLINYLKKNNLTVYVVNAQDKALQTPLMLTITNNQMHTLNILLSLAAPEILINKYDGQGNTALHHAVINQRMAAIKKLILSNADVYLQNKELKTVFDFDGTDANKEIEDALLEKKFPLHYAAKTGNISILRTAIAEKVNMEITDDKGNSLLHSAAANGQFQVVKFLVETAKLSTESLNYAQLSPAKVALQHHYNEISTYLNTKYYKDLFYHNAGRVMEHPLSQTAASAVLYSGAAAIFNSWSNRAKPSNQGANESNANANQQQIVNNGSRVENVDLTKGKELVTKIGMEVGTQVAVTLLTHSLKSCSIQ